MWGLVFLMRWHFYGIADQSRNLSHKGASTLLDLEPEILESNMMNLRWLDFS